MPICGAALRCIALYGMALCGIALYGMALCGIALCGISLRVMFTDGMSYLDMSCVNIKYHFETILSRRGLESEKLYLTPLLSDMPASPVNRAILKKQIPCMSETVMLMYS